jgi:cystathionine beta-lyase
VSAPARPAGHGRTPFLPLDELRRRRSVKWRLHDDDVLPLWVAEMDVALAPAIAEALSAAVARGDTGYSDGGRMREAYAAFASARLGWAPDPMRTSLAADVLAGIAAVLRAATPPDAGVVITPPVYPPFRLCVEGAGRTVVEVPLVAASAGGWALDLTALERAFAGGAAAFVLCHPHNPTGSVWPRDVLVAVADLAARYDVLVVADEVHAPLTYPGTAFVPWLSLDHDGAQRSVSVTSASKAFNVPGLKAALVPAGAEAAPAVAELPWLVQAGAGLLGTIAAEAAFTGGGAWLDDLVVRLDANRRLLARLLHERLPAIAYRPPDATYLAWLDCRALGLGDDPAAIFLERGRVALNAGHTFGDPWGRGWVRLNLGTSPELITAAVGRMVAALPD